jgi:hypothetical protein
MTFLGGLFLTVLTAICFFRLCADNNSSIDMDPSYGVVAEHFTKLDETRMSQLVVLPPYEPKTDISLQWVRGSIRLPSIQPSGQQSGGYRDLVVTGPRMKVVYGGCRYNRMVLALPGAALPDVYAFELWLRSLMDTVKANIWANPSKYRSGASSNVRFTFDQGIIRPSSDPIMYPDELSTRLSTKKITNLDLEEGAPTEYIDTEFITDNENGGVDSVDPTDIVASSTIIPIFRVSYNRNIERFGLVLTLLKAKVFPPESMPYGRIDNQSWAFDDPMDTQP